MSTTSTSPAPSESQPKSSRVCLNCRRKKKRCDKGLPSCTRCLDSRQHCQHEDDFSRPSTSGTPGPLMGQYVPPTPEHRARQQSSPGWNTTLSPSLFATMDSLEDNIHYFVFRCLFETLDNRQGVEQVVASYFEDAHIWFPIICQSTFDRQLDDMWTTPSAETGLLVLCMRLLIRQPFPIPISGMDDSHYLSAKTTLNLVQSKRPFSIPLLQAELLIALYEFSHSMPQQAYLSVGKCFQVTRAFGWHNEAFWSQGHQAFDPRGLKLSSLLWWAIVYVDCLIHVGYQEQRYPLHTSGPNLAYFQIPFPEAFDQYLPGSISFQLQGDGFGFLDGSLERLPIDAVVWPGASSAGYLRDVLERLSSPSPPSLVERNNTTESIMRHTINLLETKSTAAVGANFIALMKLNQAGLLTGAGASSSLGPTEMRPIETIRYIIDSICEIALNVDRFGHGAPCGAFAAYYACLLLISHGDNVLQDTQWLFKVENLKKTLSALCRRWKIAEQYLESVNLALNNRLAGYAL
ncbi:hypothetical protein B0T17DRAFT_509947 [Bombardia bombarda]|uniref:Zn(2)-C6 fungal-type domain-containing protein n=1 Tax=Bombardia bombarda TaxID=252184 RepID=A0AA39WN14_9PEZI|nr:hypothetical protein B0T17DRAFT_509947 [Bombardia bombarda]